MQSKIKMVVNPKAAIGIDTSEDQKKVKQFLNNLS
jgi:CMP-2-keto-3-deoxyoctulosonic acid synthetase